MSHANHPASRIEPVGLDRQSEALALAYGDLEPVQLAQQVAQLRAQYADGPICGLWAAYRGSQVVAAMRAAGMAGKTAQLTVPRLVGDEPAETARLLLVRAVEALSPQGVRLAQVLLDTDHGPTAELLAGGGFRHAGDLLYLVSVLGAFPESPPAEHLDFAPYSPARHRQFARLVERTYADSLDWPGLDGVRHVDDVLAGYRAGCDFDPALWLAVGHGGAEVGCLLISPEAENVQWELTYMGVVPEARRRGFGLEMARHAQWLAGNRQCGRLVLAVDAANAPAQRVYAAAGFAAWDRRSVFLRVL